MKHRIHPTAAVGKDVELGEGTVVGPHAVLEDGVRVGRDNVIGAACRLHTGTTLGDRNRLMGGASVGGAPQHLKYGGEPTACVIGDENWIGEYVTINRGTAVTGETRIGDRNFLMAYSHVGHDCRVGNHVVMANGVPLGGEVEVGDRVNLGGNSAVHQFCRVGELAMVGGLIRITQDVMPYAMVGDDNALTGLNRVGLRRAGHSAESLSLLKVAYRRFCLHREPREAMLAWLAEHRGDPLLDGWHAFLSGKSRRGYARARRRGGGGNAGGE